MAPPSVDQYVKRLPREQADSVNALRALVRSAVPAATESIKWAQPVFEVNGPMIFIKAHSQHVNFGFWRGAQLPDPKGVLQGGGSKMKHVKLARLSDVNTSALTALVKAAAKLNRELGDPTRSR
jgi:hypothetical protein